MNLFIHGCYGLQGRKLVLTGLPWSQLDPLRWCPIDVLEDRSHLETQIPSDLQFPLDSVCPERVECNARDHGPPFTYLVYGYNHRGPVVAMTPPTVPTSRRWIFSESSARASMGDLIHPILPHSFSTGKKYSGFHCRRTGICMTA